MRFIGRDRELALLHRELAAVDETDSGRFLLVRGRRRVGKSRLVEEFLGRADVDSVFFTATRGRSAEAELQAFAAAVDQSALASPADDIVARSWDGALSMLAATARRPFVVVLDEFPFLVEGSPEVEGAVQNVWDRTLSRHPVLLVLIGSDVAVMEGLTAYERPLYGRPSRVLRVQPLDPAEVTTLLDVPAAIALDDYLVVGGLPELVRSRADAPDLEHFLRTQIEDATSPLIVAGERSVTAQFPQPTPARQVLRAIGSDAAAFGRIADRSGVPRATLQRTLDLLVSARVLSRDVPLAAPPGRHRRYRVAEPALRFWLRYLDRGLTDIERGRGDLVLDRIARDWREYRGRAIEPIVRDALTRALPDERLRNVNEVGSWWTRNHQSEVDLVGVDDADAPTRVSAIGTIRWREHRPLRRHDLAQLRTALATVPGTDERTRLIGVGRVAGDPVGFDATLLPEDVVDCYRAGTA